MVAPISGPFQKIVTDSNYYSACEGWKQAKPHDLVLPYKRGVASNYVAVGPNRSRNLKGWSAIAPLLACHSWS